MSDRVLYHSGEQYAAALIAPIRSDLRVLESRAQHYVDHLRLPPADRELIAAAQAALAEARREVERLLGAARAAGQ